MTPDRARVRRLNAAALLGLPLCVLAGGFELWRALQGNELSWVYAAEWPLIGGYAVVIWRRLVHEQAGASRPRSATPARTDAAPLAGPPADDPGLRAWQDYLARLHASQPPGGPPREGTTP
ncbi:MAG: hypothetical protein ABI131_02700 [Nostocoides sp.]